MSKKGILLLTFLLVCFVGCSKKTDEIDAEGGGADIGAQVQSIFDQADIYYSQGRTNDAVKLLNDAYANDEYSEYCKNIAWFLINSYIQQGNLADAKAMYLDVLSKDPKGAMSLFGAIEFSIKEEGDINLLDEWCFELISNPNSLPDLQAQALWYLEDVYAENNNWPKVEELIKYANDNFDKSIRYRFVEASLRQLISAQQFAVLDKLIGSLSLSSEEDDELRGIILDIQFSSQLKQGKLDEAGKLYKDSFATLSERSRNNNFSKLLSEYNNRKDYSSADALISMVRDGLSVSDPSYKVFTRAWVKQAKIEGKPSELNARILLVLDSDASDKFKQSLVSSFFYYTMDNISVEEKRELVERVVKLFLSTEDEVIKESLASISLDGCFLLNDFDGALEVVTTYEWPEENKAMRKDKLIPKIKAHKALLENDYPTAVKHFREFMAVIAKEPEETFMDPYTGNQISVNSILGLNAERIAGLWEKAGDSEKATAAYGEALGYYREALAAEKKDSAQYKSIQEQINKLESKK